MPWRFQSMPGGVKVDGPVTPFPTDQACGNIGSGSFSETEALQTNTKDDIVPLEEGLNAFLPHFRVSSAHKRRRSSVFVESNWQ